MQNLSIAKKEYTTIRKFYAWVGFVFTWSLLAPLSIFIVWSMFEQDKAINLLVNIFS